MDSATSRFLSTNISRCLLRGRSGVAPPTLLTGLACQIGQSDVVSRNSYVPAPWAAFRARPHAPSAGSGTLAYPRCSELQTSRTHRQAVGGISPPNRKSAPARARPARVNGSGMVASLSSDLSAHLRTSLWAAGTPRDKLHAFVGASGEVVWGAASVGRGLIGAAGVIAASAAWAC